MDMLGVYYHFCYTLLQHVIQYRIHNIINVPMKLMVQMHHFLTTL